MNKEIIKTTESMKIVYFESGDVIPPKSIYLEKIYTRNNEEYYTFLVPTYVVNSSNKLNNPNEKSN